MILPAHIQITSLKHDEPGAVLFVHCDLCKSTVIVLCEHAIRPTDGGDAWWLTGFCLDEPIHNLPVLNQVKMWREIEKLPTAKF
jgi:hypothetical protein